MIIMIHDGNDNINSINNNKDSNDSNNKTHDINTDGDMTIRRTMKNNMMIIMIIGTVRTMNIAMISIRRIVLIMIVTTSLLTIMPVSWPLSLAYVYLQETYHVQ